MFIRNEEPRDHDAIHQLTTRAFEPMPFGFRSDGRLTYGSVDPRYVQWIVFDGQPPIGELKFAPAVYLAG
ncbi:hypothetical protein EJ066_29460 [Mesorhizobium sp. M9A.F.Ca.ET.002.03.1.2]|nr:hypothetical protein EJ066_29460 [Mesorhizobium sp. M9A.F.Ca.ET.002.03.1.2]